MEKIIKKIRAWHEKTFPTILPENQRVKVIEEWCEFHNAAPEKKLAKLADVFIANAGWSRFCSPEASRNYGHIYAALKRLPAEKDQLLQAVEEKMKKNLCRTWTIAGGEYRHNGDDGG